MEWEEHTYIQLSSKTPYFHLHLHAHHILHDIPSLTMTKETVSSSSSMTEDELYLATLSSSEMEALQSVQLRYQFRDHQFHSTWRYLHEAGVVHRSSKYYARGFVYEGANELTALLDQVSVPPVDNRLEMMPVTINSSDNIISEEELKNGREIRNSTLLRFFRKGQKYIERGTGHNNLTSNIDHAIAAATEGKARQPRSATINNQHQSKSVTVVESGADLLLRGNRNPQKRKRKGEDSAMTHDNTMPSPHAVAAMYSSPKYDAGASQQYGTKDFEEWRFLMSTNHSVFLHGLGSKQGLLEDFRKYIRNSHSGDVICIQGHHRDVTFDGILDLFVTQFLDAQEPNHIQDLSIRSTGISTPGLLGSHPWVRRAMAVGQALAERAWKRKKPIFWCLHNIDGLNNRTLQEGIAALLVNARVTKDSSGLRLLASVDHVNASAVLWDTSTLSNLAVCWKEVHTFQTHLEEIQWGTEEEKKTIKISNRAKAQLERSNDESFTLVLSALSPRHSDIIRVLASLQLDAPDKPVDYVQFFQQCKHKCLLKSDSELRQYLTELVDHGLVERLAGGRLLKIPYTAERLHDILAYQR